LTQRETLSITKYHRFTCVVLQDTGVVLRINFQSKSTGFNLLVLEPVGGHN